MSGVLSIEGNLGAGKSTLLSLLDVNIIKEPVEEWQNVGGKNFLSNYYLDPKRWAFTFQLHALHSRVLLWKKTISQSPNVLHFSERSPLADRFIFGEMHKETNMDEAEYSIYDSLCKSLMNGCPIKGIIYLKCSPKLCLERIRQRNRKGEQVLDLQYLEKVHDKHEEWIKNMDDVQVLTIDTGVYDIYNENEQKEVVNIMSDFITKLHIQGDHRVDVKQESKQNKRIGMSA